MNESKKLSVSMTSTERLLGWLYVPVFLILGGTALTWAFQKLGWPTDTPQGKAWLNGAFYLMNFMATVAIYHRFLAKSLIQVGQRFWGFVQAVILGLVLYYAGSWLIAWLVDFVRPRLQNVNDAEIQIMVRAQPAVMLIGTVVLVPTAEECIFRGLVFQGLYRRSRLAAYGLSTVLFCLVHICGYFGKNDALTLGLCFLEYIPAGIALAWAYKKADTIFAPILMHSLVNAWTFQSMLQ